MPQRLLMPPVSPRFLLAVLALLCVAASVAGLFSGSGPAGAGTLLDAIAGRADRTEVDIILHLRLPRVLAALGTGACLAVAGVLMQVLLRNPLADPYILGTSGGAAVGALAVLLLGGAGLLVNVAAFGGALLSTLLVFLLAGRSGTWAAERLLLTGIVVAAGWGALVSLLLAVSPDVSLRGILFWLMGDFAFADSPWPVVLAALAGLPAAVLLGRTLDVMATGDRQAALLGVEVSAVRGAIYALASLLTALAVTTAGIVGFVGLIVPHLVRLAGGSAHRFVLPGSALAGGALLVIADTVARTALAPRQLPVGAITAAVGVPLFLLLLRREARRPDA